MQANGIKAMLLLPDDIMKISFKFRKDPRGEGQGMSAYATTLWQPIDIKLTFDLSMICVKNLNLHFEWDDSSFCSVSSQFFNS